MAIVCRQIVVPFHAGLEIVAPEVFLEVVRRDRLQRDRRNHAERADGNLRSGHRFGIPVGVDVKDRPVRLNQPHADRLGRQAAKTHSRAMRAGRQGAGDRLGVDIALIGERQPDLLKSAADIADPRACAHDDALAIEVGADEPLHVRQAQQQAAGCDDWCERMAGAGYADGKILTRSLAHERSQFVLRTRLRLVPGDEGLVANPIAPVAARPELRRRRVRDTNHVVIPLTARHREHQQCALLARANDIGRRKAASNDTSGIKEAPL